jgi:hypothetical protein
MALKNIVFGDAQNTPPSNLPTIMKQAEELAKRVARESIRVVASQKQLTPLSCEKNLSVFMLRPNQSHLDPETLPLREFLHEHHPQCRYRELGPNATADNYAQAIDDALSAVQVVIGMVVKPAAWYRFGLLPEQDQFVRDVTSKRECVLVSLGSPVALDNYDNATERLCAFSDVFVTQAALADCLCVKGAR